MAGGTRGGELRVGRERRKLTGNQHAENKWDWDVIKESCRAAVWVAKVCMECHFVWAAGILERTQP